MKQQYTVKSGKSTPGALVIGTTQYTAGQVVSLTPEEYEQNKRFLELPDTPKQQAKER